MYLLIPINSVAIGANAFVTASNTIQLGSDGSGSYPAITNVNTSGVITSGSVTYPNSAIYLVRFYMSVSGLVGRIIFNISKLFYQIIQMIRLCYGWRFINKNNKILEISRVTNSDPSTIGVYATVYNGNSGAFNANPDGSGGPVTQIWNNNCQRLNLV
jgi:hypothetical protein